ncbi:MAG: hypothetical protein NTW48_08895 [Chloroflexi bacterium]|nr:hypothetical protein [Chloroflexota bacterium]
MITGFLFQPKSGPTDPPIAPRPYIQARIRIPRLGISHALNLVVDAGSDATSLHLKDAIDIIGIQRFNELGNTTSMTGIGGYADYFREPTHIELQHDDGAIEGFDIELRIASLSPNALKDLNSGHGLKAETHEEVSRKLRLPSVLGRDVIRHFRMVFDCCKPEFYFTH